MNESTETRVRTCIVLNKQTQYQSQTTNLTTETKNLRIEAKFLLLHIFT